MPTLRMPQNLIGEAWRRQTDEFMREALCEMYLALSGRKDAPDLAGVFQKYGDVLRTAVVQEVLRDLRQGTIPNPGTRMIANWLVTTLTMQETAEELQRTMQWQAQAVIKLPDGRTVPYFAVDEAIRNASTRAEQEVINHARAALVATELSPLVAHKLSRERKYALELEIAPTYAETWQRLNAVDLAHLTTQCREFLAATNGLWDAVRHKWIGDRAETRGTSHAVLQLLLRPRKYGSHFAAVDLQSTIMTQIQRMGLDPTAGGRIIVDAENRVGKDSRASCVSVDVPNEIYLIVDPKGGQVAWSHMLHEFGHALHYAHTEPQLPIEYRRFGDTALTETYAYLFDHLLHEPRWVAQAVPTMRGHAEAYSGALAAEELYVLRRYCAKLMYECELYAAGANWDMLPSVYAQIMTDATGYRHFEGDAFTDIDSGLYVAHYIRARQGSAALAQFLETRFGAEWWSVQTSGAWIASELFSVGYRWTLDEMVTGVLEQGLSFEPLLCAIEARLVRAAVV